jgi:hypothetical protein
MASIIGDVTLPAFSTYAHVQMLSAELTLPAFYAEATLTVGRVIRADVTLPAFTAEAVVPSAKTIDADVTFPPLTIEARTTTGKIIRGDITLPTLKAEAKLLVGNSIRGDVTLPTIVVNAEVIARLNINAAATLPPLQVMARMTSVLLAQYEAWVANTATLGHAKYENFTPDSFVSFNGQEYLFGAAGILKVGGKTDYAVTPVPVDSKIASGVSDLGSPWGKTLSFVLLACRADGAFNVSTVVDEAKENQYAVASRLDKPGIHEKRVPLAKGIKGNQWQFKLETSNVECEFAELTVSPIIANRNV